MEVDTAHLLWTGGWDSSFRLLQLLLIRQKHVQPYYVFDTTRKSLPMELDAMQSIRQRIKASFPEASKRMYEVKYIHKDDIIIKKEVKHGFDLFRKQYPIGSQYLWLCAMAGSMNKKLELSIEKSNFNNTWMEILIPFLVSDEDGFQIISPLPMDERVAMFADFRFPILGIDKKEMENIAQENRFYDILTFTWFCHYPIFNKPCGICRPCRITKENKTNNHRNMAHPLLQKSFLLLRFLKLKGLSMMK